MFGWLVRDNKESESLHTAALLQWFELVTHPDATLHVRPLTADLPWCVLHTAVERLERTRPSFDTIVFDFARVRELRGPWGVHFALLIRLGQRLGKRVSVVGLQGQPAGVAWVFRESEGVRELVSC